MKVYDFEIIRQPLHRYFLNEKIDTGYDSIFRKDNGTQLGVVSRSYQIVKHERAIEATLTALKELEVKHSAPTVRLMGVGDNQMSCEIRITSEKFSVRRNDEFDPMIILQNSYDGFSSLSLNMGIFRYVCSNGARIFANKFSSQLVHIYNNVNLDVIKNNLKESIKQTVSVMKKRYLEMKEEDGLPYLRNVMKNKYIAKVNKNKIVEDLKDYVAAEEKKKEIQLKIKRAFNAYLLWNILTAIATHHVKGVWAKRDMDMEVAKIFFHK